jgi:hypothetical protein
MTLPRARAPHHRQLAAAFASFLARIRAGSKTMHSIGSRRESGTTTTAMNRLN